MSEVEYYQLAFILFLSLVMGVIIFLLNQLSSARQREKEISAQSLKQDEVIAKLKKEKKELFCEYEDLQNHCRDVEKRFDDYKKDHEYDEFDPPYA